MMEMHHPGKRWRDRLEKVGRTSRRGKWRETGRRLLRGQLRLWHAVVLAFALAATLIATQSILSGWRLTDTLRHLAASPSCHSARLVGLAPSIRGNPGYFEH